MCFYHVNGYILWDIVNGYGVYIISNNMIGMGELCHSPLKYGHLYTGNTMIHRESSWFQKEF